MMEEGIRYAVVETRAGPRELKETVKTLMTDTLGMAGRITELSAPADRPTKPLYPGHPSSKDTYAMFYTQVKQLVNPEDQTETQAKIEETMNRVYRSTRRMRLGRGPPPDLPDGAEERIMGVQSFAGVGADQKASIAVSPPISQEKVVLRDVLTRELYKKSHGSYPPGEQINRNYVSPVISKDKIWGKPSKGDPNGRMMRQAMEWFDQNRVSTTSNRQARHALLHRHPLGQVSQPNRNMDCVEVGHTYGKVEPLDLYGASELMSEAEPDPSKARMSAWLRHLNAIRAHVKNMKPPFPHLDFLDYFKVADSQGKSCGCLPAEIVYSACGRFGVKLEPVLLEPLLKKAGIMHPNGHISYHGFAKIISPRYALPDFGKTTSLPQELLLYESTYQAMNNDLKKSNSGMPTAGLKTDRTDLLQPVKLACQADKKHLCGETSVEAVLKPSVFTLYGLSHRDLFMPRSKSFMKELLKRIELDVPDSVFETMWVEGVSRDEQDASHREARVSVETFRNMLDEITAGRMLQLTT